MKQAAFPVIDLPATGKNILRLRKARGLTVRDLQEYFGFEVPQAIYKWQKGQSLPTVDNLYALGALLEVPIEDILIPKTRTIHTTAFEQQAAACCSNRFFGMMLPCSDRLFWIRQRTGRPSIHFGGNSDAAGRSPLQSTAENAGRHGGVPPHRLAGILPY